MVNCNEKLVYLDKKVVSTKKCRCFKYAWMREVGMLVSKSECQKVCERGAETERGLQVWIITAHHAPLQAHSLLPPYGQYRDCRRGAQ